MKSSVIREMSLAEIREKIEVEKNMYLKLRMNHVVSSLENPLKLKYARKTIARLCTELTKRENISSKEPSSDISKAKGKGVINETEEANVQEDADNNKTE